MQISLPKEQLKIFFTDLRNLAYDYVKLVEQI